MEDYDYSFSQNGLVAYKAGELIAEQVRADRRCVCVVDRPGLKRKCC